MHAPFGSLTRQCTKAYKIPNTDIVIEEGTGVWVSVYGIHYDPNYFDNPTQFKPERFDESINGKKTFIEMPYLAFGDGPRNCIGLRFGKLQAKLGIVLLLKKYKFDLADEHKNKELKINPRSGAKAPMNGINLKVYSRSEQNFE